MVFSTPRIPGFLKTSQSKNNKRKSDAEQADATIKDSIRSFSGAKMPIVMKKQQKIDKTQAMKMISFLLK